jgi:YbgC/YbaW family acyl-CoA thioester hydrolase
MKTNTVERRIMWGDLDALGIVFYPRFYEWMDGCAHLFFDTLGLEQMSLWREHSIIFGLVETGCRYSRPARYHQNIRIVTHIGEMDNKTLTLHHRIVAATDESPLLQGFEKRICMDVSDPANIRGREFPDAIRSALASAMR